MTSFYSASDVNHDAPSSDDMDLFAWFEDNSTDSSALVLSPPNSVNNVTPPPNGNGDRTASVVSAISPTTIQQSVAAIVTLKAELEKTGALSKPEFREQLQHLVELVRESHTRGTSGSMNLLQKQLKAIRQRISAIAHRIRQATSLDSALQTAVVQVLETLGADRVLVYRFDSKLRGTVLAESVAAGWAPALDENLPALCFGLETAADYGRRPQVAIYDISKIHISPYQKQLLEKFQVKSSLALPIALDQQVWGLFVIQQCSKPRGWQEVDVNVLSQITAELTLVLQSSDFRTRQQQWLEQEKVLAKLVNRIYQSMDVETIFRTTTHELRQALQCDRVAIYRFNPDWSGRFVAESVATGWTPLLEEQERNPFLNENASDCSMRMLRGDYSRSNDDYMRETQGGQTQSRKCFIEHDLLNSGLNECYIELLQRYEAKAYVIVPIYQKDKVWGMLAAYQNSGPRYWQESEISIISQLANQFGIALGQADYIKRLQRQSAQLAEATERERTVTKVIDRIRRTLDIDDIFRSVTSEIRQLLQCDRVGIYRFNPDWSGEFVAESVASGWTSLLQEQIDNPILRRNISECSAKELAGGARLVTDTYLQQTQGGLYSRGVLYRVTDDVYQSGFSQCYLDILERYQARAYIIVAIYQDQKLWGLLAAYQNAGPRQWQDSEIEFLLQVASQFSVAMQQAEFLKQIQTQALQLTEVTERERTVTKVINRIRRSLNIDDIFRATTHEIRQLVQCDRVAIYRFNPDWSGEFVAESVVSGWTSLLQAQLDNPILRANVSECSAKDLAGGARQSTDTYLQQTEGGLYSRGDSKGVVYRVANDIYEAGFSQCYLNVLEQYQARAYIIVAIYQDQKLWGLLAAYQNAGPRQWQDSEIEFLQQIAAQFSIAMQQAEFLKQIQAQSDQLASLAERERNFVRIIDRVGQSVIDQIRLSQPIETIFGQATQLIRQWLKTDRVAIYRFKDDWSGEFVAESVGNEWMRLVGPDIRTVWPDTHLQETQGGRYRHNETFAVEDIYTIGHSSCHVEILEQFQIRAYLIVPILTGDKLWGLLAAYQNSGPRQWEEPEVNLLSQVGSQLGVALRQAEYVDQITKATARQQAIARIIDKIRQSLDLGAIFRTTTQEVRQFIGTDRVAIYRFDTDWSGEFVAESVGGNWLKLVSSGTKTIWEDSYLQETQGGRYRNNETFAVDDIYAVGHSPCHLEILEQFEVKAYVIVPIFTGPKLWGLLGAYQNSAPRQWESSEVSFLAQIGAQLGAPIQQAELLNNIQVQAERERALTRIIENVRKSLDLDRTLRSATQDIRQLLKADRVAVYQFHPDWSGDFVAEAIAGDWVKLVGTEIGTDIADTYLQETQGGRYRNNENLVVEDIYTAGHSACHVELLEKFQAKAYVIVPILSGQKLWGLLAAYQNSDTRHWEPSETNLLTQISAQIGVAIQQAETLEQLKAQSAQLAQVATREKDAKEKLQQDIIQLLVAVRPALEGDLTVRAPVIDNEVGTVADAYNNTIQSLRKIVVQVQQTAEQVGQTSKDNSSAIALLAQQAQQEAQQITAALDQIQLMVDATHVVATNAQQVEQAVQQANQTVHMGDAAMNRTVNGILGIRETVSETMRKVKRLSESSQKISKVVNLIHNFTAQTQLLALNAAIEATRAGDYGRGFAVVADEVRSLAQQSAEATTEIETLVQEIQSETSAVATAMDAGIQQVVNGTTLVNETRQSLNAIVASTAQISELLQGITQSTQAQTRQSQAVIQTMQNVVAIANQTSTDSAEISQSFQELLVTAENLQASVRQFRVS
ncbi:MAG TPA: GAF domain-containing protein [Crinalium sp.]|jgi:methyl-accepting chemotaxis protein PixJ